MKRVIIVWLFVIGLANSTFAVDQAGLDMRIRKLTVKLDALQQKSDKRIPADHLKNAKGIILLDRTKAGFIFAYQGGSGVAMVRNKDGQWSPAAFYKANEASLGFQIGGQQSFVVILLLSTNATRLLTEQNVQFGGEARGTAGDSSAAAEGNISPMESSVLVYDDRQGLYGGAALKGGAIEPDLEANIIYYGTAATAEDILFERKVKPTEAAQDLARKLNAYSKETAK